MAIVYSPSSVSLSLARLPSLYRERERDPLVHDGNDGCRSFPSSIYNSSLFSLLYERERSGTRARVLSTRLLFSFSNIIFESYCIYILAPALSLDSIPSAPCARTALPQLADGLVLRYVRTWMFSLCASFGARLFFLFSLCRFLSNWFLLIPLASVSLSLSLFIAKCAGIHQASKGRLNRIKEIVLLYTGPKTTTTRRIQTKAIKELGCPDDQI